MPNDCLIWTDWSEEEPERQYIIPATTAGELILDFGFDGNMQSMSCCMND